MAGTDPSDRARNRGEPGRAHLNFPTKTRSLEAVPAKFRAQYLSVLEGRLAHGDVADGIVHSFEGIFSGEFDPAVFHQPVMSAADDPEVREVMRADAREDRNDVRELLKRREAEGRIPRMKDPRPRRTRSFAASMGCFIAVALRGDPGESREPLARAVRLVLGQSPGGPKRR